MSWLELPISCSRVLIGGAGVLAGAAAATALNPFHELADVRQLLPFAGTVTVLDPREARSRVRELAHRILDHQVVFTN
jgi:hypothetical protein